MRDCLWAIFELSVNFFQSAIIIQTLRSVLENKRRGKSEIIEAVIFCLFLFCELSFVNSIVPFEGLGIIISVFIVYVYAFVCLQGSVIQKLFWSVFIMLLVIGITAFVFNMEALLLNTTYLDLIVKKNYRRFIGVVIIQITLFYTSRLIIKNKREGLRYSLQWNEWLILLIIPLISIFTMSFVALGFVNLQSGMTVRQKIYFVMAVLGILVTNVLVYGMYIRLQKEHIEQMKFEILQQTLANREKNLEETKTLYQSIKRIRHDLKQHVEVALAMLQKKEYEKAMEYLQEYNNSIIQNSTIKVFCNNEAVNYLINNKCNQCRAKGIETYIFIPSCIPGISELDLCILIGNAMDNGIENNYGIEKKELYLEIRIVNNFLLIAVKNTVSSSVLKNNMQLKTTKEDKDQHGMGILSMKEIAKKYNGSISFTEEKGLFCCNILLDISESAE